MPYYEKYTGRHRDDFATLEDLQKNYKLTVPDNFNFVFDCLDVMATETPDKLALFLKWLQKGPQFSRVDSVEKTDMAPKGYEDFFVK